MITAENKPFIIDSLTGLIDKLGLQSIFTFHPVIATIRDSEKNLQNVVGRDAGGSNEALIYIKIIGEFDKPTLDSIKLKINKVIDIVNYTYNSWHTLLNKITNLVDNIKAKKAIYEVAKLPADETLDFLNWLQKNHITFLGVVDFKLDSQVLTNEEGVKEIWNGNLSEVSQIIKQSNDDYYKNKLIMLGKLNKVSPVHREALVDYILVKDIDEDGVYRSGRIIFGLYGAEMYFQSIKNLPVLRDKMNYVIEESGFPLAGYNAKKIKIILESLPRDVLIQINLDDLYCMCLHILSSMRSRKLKLFIQKGDSNSVINVVVFLPRERLTPAIYNDIKDYLSDKFEIRLFLIVQLLSQKILYIYFLQLTWQNRIN